MVLLRFSVDLPGFVLEGKGEIGRPCSCLLKASNMTNKDNRACNPSPATFATTSLELAVFLLWEVEDVAEDAGVYDLRAVIMWFGVTTGTGPSSLTSVDALEAESMALRRTSNSERTSPAWAAIFLERRVREFLGRSFSACFRWTVSLNRGSSLVIKMFTS
jgi:hypothetical protein